MSAVTTSIVYTAGCFDLFHIGHLNLLRNASGLGERLIVGVSTDDLVSEYKGCSSVVPFSERIAIVSSVRYVDLCVPQTDRNKFLAWERLGFDVWAVGDDWYGHPYYMDMRERLGSVGVRTVFLPYTLGVGSTLRRREVCNGGNI
jgi:glycerol-3-phosphate cytidylyltransferase